MAPTIVNWPRKILAGLVSVYQKTLSPDHSQLWRGFYIHGFCKYSPSCSEYMRQALLKYGVWRGLPKGLWRILRCHPWSKGGVDKP